ncbi:DMT family transporter [Streptomyces alkaliphilus]|uniref:DMT family transporter n=1 Tax=Streptomyces alkaliphilus TaxID=1472722 RepID=UPI003F67A9D6
MAVVGISLSAPLAAYVAAPALAIAFWRNAMAGAVLLPRLIIRRRVGRLGRGDSALCLLAGLFLAAHFGTWIPSLTMTSVAASTALVCTTPLWAAAIARVRGFPVPVAVWTGMAIALLGVVIVSGLGGDTSTRALVGNLLALAGGACMAAYLSVGEKVRRRVDNETYTALCYSAAAGALLIVCLATDTRLWGYEPGTWVGLVALTVAGQLVGHSLLNRALSVVSGSTVAVISLLEVPGAALIAAVWLGQMPAVTVYLGVAVIMFGIHLAIRAGHRPGGVNGP